MNEILRRARIGALFVCGGRRFRVTDVGARTLVAVSLEHDVDWLKGPPYAVEEIVFDENDVGGIELADFVPDLSHVTREEGVMTEKIDYVAEAISEAFGPKCADYSDGCPTCEAWKQYDELIAYTSTPAPPQHLVGWSVVPSVPTREMIDAWRLDQAQGRSLENSYLSMLDAAPNPPQIGTEDRITKLEDALRNFTASRDISYVEALKVARDTLNGEGRS